MTYPRNAIFQRVPPEKMVNSPIYPDNRIIFDRIEIKTLKGMPEYCSCQCNHFGIYKYCELFGTELNDNLSGLAYRLHECLEAENEN